VCRGYDRPGESLDAREGTELITVGDHIHSETDPEAAGFNRRRATGLGLMLVAIGIATVTLLAIDNGLTAKLPKTAPPRTAQENPHQACLVPRTGCSGGPTLLGLVAVTLPWDRSESTVYIGQGDHIDILATLNTRLFSPSNPHWVTRKVFAAIEVPMVGSAPGRFSSMTVAMTECDAQYMEWFLQNAALRYLLLSPSNSAATADSCQSGSQGQVGPAQVDTRWHFSTG
jgi:hypothetical protein